ncbi:hypothetical protein FACS1894184_14590 [Clostridia bacterium]|nr:hypothetical protein FACS1894184_14590 [Clostridia bacterium]
MATLVPGVYDPMLITVVVNGRTITGFAQEGVVTLARSEDSILPAVGAQGDVAYAYNANKTGTATITLHQTSASLPALRLMSQNHTKINITIVDNNDPNHVYLNSQGGQIIKVPDYTRGKEVGTAQLVFHIPYLEYND